MRQYRFVLLVACAFAIQPVTTPFAQDPSSDEIIEILMPEDASELMRRAPGIRSMRGLTVEEPEVAGSPSIDLRVAFEYDSDRLQADARIILDRLGKALTDERLEGYDFAIAGHTDARGTDEYNQDLSERRASAVRSYLMRHFDVNAGRLRAEGYGESHLLDPTRPEDGVNRRVQVRNLGQN